MTSRRTWVLLWGQVALGLAVLGAALTFLSLEDEGRLPGLPGALQGAALLAVVLPLLLALAVLVWKLSEGGPLSKGALVSPLLACALALPAFGALRLLAQNLAVEEGARAQAAALAALRSRPGKACELVAGDPHASEAEQAQCLTALEAVPPLARWSTLSPFLGPNGFSTWNPQELGTSEAWVLGREVPKFSPALQPRFLTAALDAAAAQPRSAAFEAQLSACLRRLFVQEWSSPAQAQALAWLSRLREAQDAGP